MATDEGLAIIRTKREQMKHEFITTYLAWREASDTPGIWGSEVDRLWREYCNARDEWTMPTLWRK